MKKDLKKILKFICVGISNTIISLIIYYLLKFIGVNYLISMAVGYFISSITGYFLNKKWVFENQNKKKKSIFRYYVLYISALFLNLIFTYFQVSILKISDNVAPLITVAVITIYNYLISNYWVFNPSFKLNVKEICTKVKNNKMFYIIMIIMCILLFFLFINNKYIHPVADDYSNVNNLVIFESDKSIDSIGEFIKCAFNRTINIYQTWQGTYFSNIFFSLNPLLVSVNFYKFAMFLIQLLWLGSTLFLFKTFAKEKKNIKNAIILGMLFVIYTILSLYSLGEGFYWFTGAVLYILPYSLSLVLFGLIIKYLRKPNKMLLIFISVIIILLAGTNYVTGLFVGFVLACITLYKFINKEKERFTFLILTILFGSCFLVNVLCPGNFNRVNEIESISNFKILKYAVINSYEMIKYLLFKTIYIPLLVIALPLIKDLVKKTKIKYVNPIIMLALCSICFVCLFMPMAFSYKNLYQETRVENIQLLYLAIMVTLNMINIIGYYNVLTKIDDSKMIFAGVILIIIMISSIGTENLQGFILIDDIIYEKSYSYNYCLNAMESKLKNSKKDKVEINNCSVYPNSIHYYKMENSGWINDAMSTYYNKKIEVNENEN